MKKVVIMPLLAAVLFAGACGEPTAVTAAATVRFFNATTGVTGNGAFTTNGQFVSGSAIGFGQSTQQCSTVDASAVSFGFGAANAGGTSMSGDAIATLTNQSLKPGGAYTVVATGSATSPTLFLLDDNYAGTLAATYAAVRFVNLAPGTEAAPNEFVVFRGTVGGDGTILSVDLEVGVPTSFGLVGSGSNTFSILKMPGHVIAVSGPAGTFNFADRTVTTMAIVPNGSGGFQLIPIPRC
jgi:hypothetical protein